MIRKISNIIKLFEEACKISGFKVVRVTLLEGLATIQTSVFRDSK